MIVGFEVFQILKFAYGEIITIMCEWRWVDGVRDEFTRETIYEGIFCQEEGSSQMKV